MPSQIIHLAIAKKYLEKHPGVIADEQAFIDGNVLPDLNPDKAVSHCGIRKEMHDLVKRNKEKVNPEKFAKTHDMTDPLNQGQYLHLYVDDQYYNVLLVDYFRHISIPQSLTDMYETTRRDDAYLCEKYGVAYTDSSLSSELQLINDLWDNERAKMRRQPDYKFNYAYTFSILDRFIDEMSNVDIPQK